MEQHQVLMARLFHQIGNKNTDEEYKLFVTARKHFGAGGVKRIEYTLPPMVFRSLELARRIRAREDAKDAGIAVRSKKVFGFVHKTASALAKDYPNLTLRLFYQAAKTANDCGYEAIAYEFMTQCFITYETEISDSNEQVAAIKYLVGALPTLTCFAAENYDTLVTKTIVHSTKLLKKSDQCRAVASCAHLFWAGTSAAPCHRDEKRVVACLSRSLKLATSGMGRSLGAFVDILNKYLFFYAQGCPSVKPQHIKTLIARMQEIQTEDDEAQSSGSLTHFKNTIAHIRSKQALGDDTAAGKLWLALGDPDESTVGAGDVDDDDSDAKQQSSAFDDSD
jgi:vacuolar protein sorting-associated protein 35